MQQLKFYVKDNALYSRDGNVEQATPMAPKKTVLLDDVLVEFVGDFELRICEFPYLRKHSIYAPISGVRWVKYRQGSLWLLCDQGLLDMRLSEDRDQLFFDARIDRDDSGESAFFAE